MYIFISNAGVYDHIAGIREEQRYMELLREKLRLLYQLADSTTAAPALLRECSDRARILAESFQWRIDFLKALVEDMQRANEKVGWMIDNINRAIGENGT